MYFKKSLWFFKYLSVKFNNKLLFRDNTSQKQRKFSKKKNKRTSNIVSARIYNRK